MTETVEKIPPTLHHSDVSNNSDVEAPPTLPAELWDAICRFLRLYAEAENLETHRFEPPYYHALRSLGQTSRFFYLLTLPIRAGVIYIEAAAGSMHVRGQPKSGSAVDTAFLVGSKTPVMEVMKHVAGPRQLIFTEYSFYEQHALDWAIAIPTVTSLTLRRCRIDKGDSTWAPYMTVDLRQSNVKTLYLDYPYAERTRALPPTLASLALIPSLENLIATPVSFRRLGQVLTTQDLPPLRSLAVISLSHLEGWISRPHIFSFLCCCPTLETLHISRTIGSMVLEAGELPANLPSLKEYEGRPEYLTLIHAPALHRVVVNSLQWDEANAVIRSLASVAPDLETVVLELTTRMNDPEVNSIGRWVEEAAGRWNPHLGCEGRFSLVIRTAPFGEWIYSAKVGRAESGEIFVEYYSRREESMAYLAASAN